MAWQTPKTNWKISDFFNYSDYNRIVGNLDFLKNEISDLIDSVDGYTQLETNKDYNSIFYSEEMNAIENNLEALNLTSYNLNIGSKTSYTINGSTPLYSEFNRIESAILSLKARIDSQKANNTAPTIEITSEYGNWAESNKYTVTGIITDNGNGIGSVTINHVPSGKKELSLDDSGNFSINFTLDPGINDFTVRAVDDDNNPSSFSFIVKQDNKAPKIVITSASGYVASSDYTLTGNVVDTESGVQTVTINGEPVTVNSNSTFSKTYTLSGTTTFTIEATDVVGNKSVVSHNVIYDTSSHTATLTTALITKRGTSSSTNASYSHNGFDSGAQGNNYYISRRRREQCDGMGNVISATATYKGTVNVSTLPNWEYIKKIVIGRYGQSSITKYLDGTIATIDFTDTSTASTDVHIVGDYGDVTAKAGISLLKYYYTT